MSRSIGATGRGKMQFVSDRAAVPLLMLASTAVSVTGVPIAAPRGCAFVLISHVPDADV